MLTILDESGSIDSSGATGDVRDAFGEFTRSLANTGSTMAVIEFSTVARAPIPTYTEITDATIASTFNPYIQNDYRPNGRTNWEDAFRVARYFERPPDVRPLLVVFMTDGDPTAVVRNSAVTYDPGNPNQAQNEYELKVPLAESETTNVQSAQGVRPAIANANAIKALPGHVLTIALGSALNNQQSLDRLIAMSGPDVYDGTGPLEIASVDVNRVLDFDDLGDALRAAAFELCAPSLTVRKLVDLTPDPGTDDANPQANWDMTVDVAVPGGFDWVLPAGNTGPTATVATDGAGFATFQWTTVLAQASEVTVTEADPAAADLVVDPDATDCTFRTPDQPTDQPLDIEIDPVDPTTFTATIPTQAIATCRFVNRAVAEPVIDIEKRTNGADADDPPGPAIDIGDPVTWTYTVTNTGNVRLDDVAVTDDQPGVTPACPQDTLAPGESIDCEASALADAGQHANVGTATGTDFEGTTVDATDPSHHFGAAPGIGIEKATEGTDADLPPGPIVAVGDPVTWTYVVTNEGNEDLENVIVTDDQPGVTPACPQDTLDVGESMTCTATGTATAGQYANLGEVSSNPVVAPGTVIQAADPSHHYGAAPAIDIEKSTNGVDADTPAEGPVVGAGAPVVWAYTVTNTGNDPIVDYTVTDDQIGPITCTPAILLPGQSAECQAVTGTAVDGPYANTATVDGTALGGFPVGDADPSHHSGVQPAISVEKATNGEDADQAPGPLVSFPGGAVDWTYVVANQGDEPLVDVVVADNRLVDVACPQTTLQPGEQMTCTASATADVAGVYTNVAGAAGQGEISGSRAVDLDPSHYFGAQAGVDVEKSTNGLDADEPPGPFVLIGEPVEWTYRVTNTGNDALGDIAVVDDQGVAVSCPETALGPGEAMDCTASGIAQDGQYANVATVTAVDATAQTVTDSDPSHHLGGTTGIDVEKSTNGEDADSPPGPALQVGDPVTWRYEVRPAGDLAIIDVELVDDRGATPAFEGGDTDGDGILDVGETWVYEATGAVEVGQYANVATATGLSELESTVTDADPSHHLGREEPPPTTSATTLPPTSTSTATSTTTPPTVAPATDAPPTLPDDGGGGTASTGSNSVPWVLVGLILLVAGGAATLAARGPSAFGRRRDSGPDGGDSA